VTQPDLAQPWNAVLDSQRLRQLRRQRGLSRERLAYRAGISLTTVANLERQPFPACRLSTLTLLAAALDENPASITRSIAQANRTEGITEVNFLPGHGPLRDDGPGKSLQIIASELRARGLEAREYGNGIEVVEIVITNARDKTLGRVNVGYDGQVTWQHAGDIGTRAGIVEVRDTIRNLLAGDVPQSRAWRASSRRPVP
jgi:transcriptional regulator with XRE-family HTH domain